MSSTYDRITLAFKEWLGLIGYSPSTVQHMPRRVQEFFTFLETQQVSSLQQVEHRHIQGFYQLQKDRASHNSGKPLSNSTVNGYLRNLRLLAQYLQETGQGFLEVDIPNEPKATPEKEILTTTEIMQLYNAIDKNITGLRDRAMLSVYYGCGLRSNEGVQLNISDILLEKGLLYVRKGKGYKERYVPFVESQYQDFKNYLNYCRPGLSKDNKEQEAFMLNSHGRRITYLNALTILKTLQQRTGNEALQNKPVGLHTLRHSITYNLLNLPASINMGSYTINYTYDASGRKIKKESGSTTIDYIDGIQYSGGNNIDFVQTEDGRVLGPTTSPNYEYTLADHLGNSRVTFDSSHGGTTATQVDDYYPFGLVSTEPTTSSPPNKYLYNKKELQDGINQYDYGARFYDPVIARWTSVDPLAEKSRRFSPYVYGKNNSIIMVDPDGMFDVHINGSESQAATDELQKSVQGQLNISRDAQTGNVTYTQVDGAKLDANATQLKNAIDDHSVDVRVNATTNTKDVVGGAFEGNTVTKGADGKNTVVANQEVNPGVLKLASDYYGKPGSGMLHEVTEAYQGAKISQGTGISSPIGSDKPGNVYKAAHAAATPQPGPIISKVTDANGNFLSAPYTGASWVIWLVSDGVKEPQV